jgi:hypothetical protein
MLPLFLSRQSVKVDLGGENMLAADSLGNRVCDPVRVKAIHRFEADWTKSQILIDFCGLQGYLLVNRTRHASQRCAPGGSFFALNMGMGSAA